jgi:hypothetical protein
MFTSDPASPPNATVTGPIVSGAFDGGPGSLSLQIVLGAPTPITLNMVNARVKATSITADGMSAIVGGMVLSSELTTNVLPAVAAQLVPIIDRDCPVAARNPPTTCGCTVGSTGQKLLALPGFDPDHNCVVTVDELKNAGLVKTLLGADVCSTASCTTPDALSVGIQVKAVKATF